MIRIITGSLLYSDDSKCLRVDNEDSYKTARMLRRLHMSEGMLSQVVARKIYLAGYRDLQDTLYGEDRTKPTHQRDTSGYSLSAYRITEYCTRIHQYTTKSVWLHWRIKIVLVQRCFEVTF